MVQKMDIREMNIAICGTGRIDETKPIHLEDYTIGYSPYRNEPVPVMVIPKKIRFSRMIADTVYDVTGSFDTESDTTLLQQLKELLLKKQLPQN